MPSLKKISRPHLLSILAILVLAIAQLFVIRYAYRLKYSELEFVYGNVYAYASPFLKINWKQVDELTQDRLNEERLFTGEQIDEAYLKELQALFIDNDLIRSEIEKYFGQWGLLDQMEFLLVARQPELIVNGRKFNSPDGYQSIPLEGDLRLMQQGHLVYRHIASSNYLKTDIELYIHFPNKISLLIGEMKWVLILSIITFMLVSYVAIFNLRNWQKQKAIADIKDDLINHISHEFRTPITSINIASDSIVNNAPNLGTPRIIEISELIRRQAKRLQHMVENLLNTAFLDHEQHANFQPVIMDEFLTRYVESLKSIKTENQISIDLDTQAGEATVNADLFLIESMLNNLIDNAIKYCNGSPIIDIKTIVDTKYYTLSIKDNGKGMSEAQLANVFEKFQRHDRTSKGLGLGLYHVMQITLLHKGDISVKSTPGEGTTFQISLPYE